MELQELLKQAQAFDIDELARRTIRRLKIPVVESGMSRPITETALLVPGSVKRGRKPDFEDSAKARAWRRGTWGRIREDLAKLELAHMLGISPVFPTLYLTVYKANGNPQMLGLASTKSVTVAGVGYLVDAWQNLTELENMKFHGLGTSSTAEATSGAGSALVSELTTQYTPDNTRATGTTAEGASGNIFRSVATNTLDGAASVTEHAVVSAATGAHVTWDRSVFGGLALVSGDALESTYDATFPSGG